ncbi:MAG: D-alanine--D-alanine ligase family protein [Clostridia bacterium]
MKKINLGVIFGGVSTEHEISILSAASILKNLDRERYNILPIGITKNGEWRLCPSLVDNNLCVDTWNTDGVPVTLSVDRERHGLYSTDGACAFYPLDCVFPVLHGMNGEDGTIQGLFEIAGIPYVGCDTAASAVSMDKSLTKLVVRETGVRQADWVLVRARELQKDMDTVIARVEAKFKYPVFVKPARCGSSVGIGKAKSREALSAALLDAARYDPKILVEEFIDGREIETAVIGNEDARVSVCGEILPAREFYNYEAKYLDETSRTCVPAHLPENVSEETRAAALKIYEALDCTGLARVDFFVDRHDMSVGFNEINTIPGFTDISMYAKLFAHCGVSFTELLNRLVLYARGADAERRKYK